MSKTGLSTTELSKTDLTIADVEAAAGRLAGVAHRTPVLTSRTLNQQLGAEVFLKAECFQRTGSFKFRGAYSAISALTNDERANGVASFSSGNHAQAVALAAGLHRIPAVIVMPEDAPTLKMAATVGYGAEIVTYDRFGGDRDSLAEGLAADRGMTLIPPFNHWDVMAGQGTAALELFDEVGPLDTLVVCVGGGGLISGCATVAKAQPGRVHVIGVEPEAGDDGRQSLAKGEIVTIPTPRTIADGQQTTSLGSKTFAVISDRVDSIELVSDAEILAAMRFAFERLNIVLEPSGASALGALLAGTIDVSGQRVGVTLSGGNIGVERFVDLLSA